MAGEPAFEPTAAADAHPDDPGRWRHDSVRLSGVTLHYVTVEPDPAAVDSDAEPPLVVLLHGFPGFWYDWRGQLDALADAGARVVAPDMRGYNRSSAPDGVDAYRLETLVGDVRGLVAALGYARASLVGHDWGGVIAWETAVREPDLLDRVAVLNAPHPERLRRALRSPRQLGRIWYAGLFQVPVLSERLLAARGYAAVERALQRSSRGAFTDRALRRYRAAMARSGPTGPLNYYRAALREGLTRETGALLGDPPAARVDAPTLLVWGERDPALGTDLLEGLDRHVPDLRVERLPTVAHWPQVEAPDRTAELLADLAG